MFSFVFSGLSLLLSFAYRTALRPFKFLRHFLTLSTKNQIPDVEKSPVTEIQTHIYRPSGYADTTLTVQYQLGLDIIGVGAAGQVYNVDDHTVLKACRIYEPPSQNATPRALWDYASETVFHSGLLKDERAVLGLLAKRPHPNIIEVLDVDQPEGIYIRKYRPLSDFIQESSPFDRILWYQDIIRALDFLHTLGITHSDIRKDNILAGSNGHAILNDFGASCPFGFANPSLPVLLNGPCETVSGATDRFAMGSLIYEMETGVRPVMSGESREDLLLPSIQTGNNDLNSLIEGAWQGRFESTSDMLEAVERLAEDSRPPTVCSVSKTELCERILLWRKNRVKQYGCVLFSLPTDNQIQDLAERYGWCPNDERQFVVDSLIA